MGVLAKRVLPQAWNFPPPPTPASAAAAATTAASSHGSGGAGVEGQTAGDDGALLSPPPPRREVFHVSIAQCYDKKLEASRKDFRHEDLAGDAEVDLVLTTAEVLELIEERASASAAAPTTATGGPISDIARDFFRRHSPPSDIAEPLAPGFPAGQAAVSADGLTLFGGVDGEGEAGGNSGGYLEYVFRHAAAEIFSVDLAGRPLVYREGRNSDFRETSLEVRGTQVWFWLLSSLYPYLHHIPVPLFLLLPCFLTVFVSFSSTRGEKS